MTASVRTSPADVTTDVISPESNLIALTSVFVKTVAPSFLAPPAYPRTTASGVQ